jgi:hypothetical protein
MMSHILLKLDESIEGADGLVYLARVAGRQEADGLWGGWLEFEPLAGGITLRTERETVQPNRDGLEYWAAGLGATYLEGALRRARESNEGFETSSI